MRYLRARRKPIGALMIALMAFGQISPPLQAATVYWDVNSTTPGAGGAAPSGTWGGSNTFWSTTSDGTGATSAWTSGDTAVFAAGADATGSYTVTVSGTQNIGGLTFEEGATTLNGGTLNWSTPGTINVASGITTTINSSMTGSVALTRSGSGTLIVGGTNSGYSGTISLGAGVTRMLTSSALGTNTITLVNTDTVLELADGVELTNNITISNTGNAKTIRAVTGSVVVSSVITQSETTVGNFRLEANSGATLTVNSNIGGVGLRTGGSGTKTLTGNNTYTGNTQILGGTTRFSSASNLGSTGTVASILIGTSSTAATLFYEGAGDTIADALSWNGTTGGATLNASGTGALVFSNTAAIVSGAGSKTVTLTGTNSDANTIAGSIQNNSGTFLTNVSKTGSGTWVLTGANTFNNTTINGNGGTLRVTGGGRIGTAALTVNAGTLDIAGTEDQVVSSLAVAGGAAGSSATIQLGAGRKLILGGNVTTSATNNNLTATITGGSGALLDLGGASITFTVANSTNALVDLLIDSNVTLQNGSLVKAGAGTLQISSSLASLTGPVEIQAGALNASLGSLNLFLNGGVYEGSGTFSRSLGSGADQVQWGTAGGGFAAKGGSLTVTLGAAPDPLVWGATAQFAPATGTLVFGSTSSDDVVTFTHNIDLNNTGAALNRAFSVVDNTGVTTDKAVLSGVLSNSLGAGGVTKTGNGVLRLDGLNTFTGGITVSAGTLEFSTVSDNGGTASNLGQGTDGITLSGGTLAFVGNVSQSTNRAMALPASSTLDASGTGGASITYNGLITGGSAHLTLTGTGMGILNAAVTQTGTSADLNKNGTGTWRLDVAQPGLIDDVIVNAGTLILNAADAHDGDDLHIRAGTLQLNVNGALTNTMDDLNVSAETAGGGVLDINGTTGSAPNDIVLGAETLSGSIIDSLGGGSIGAIATFLFRNGVVSASLTGAAALTKSGATTVTLSGNNAGFTGSTTMTHGLLILDYTANNGEKLSDTAALISSGGGNITLNGNASGATTETLGSFTLNAGALHINVNHGSGQTATLNLGGITRATGGTVEFNLSSGNSIVQTSSVNGSGGILGGYATVNGSQFAKVSGGIIQGLSSTVSNNLAAWPAGGDLTDSTGYTGTVSDIMINSLRFNAPGVASAVTVASGSLLTIRSGGILVTSNVGGGTASITGGVLAGSGNELIVHQNNGTSAFTIGSSIVGSTALTKSGPGTLLLNGTNTYSGQTTINEGTLQLSGGNAIGNGSSVAIKNESNAVLDLNNSSETIAGLTSFGGLSTSSPTLGLVAIGSGTLTLSLTAARGYQGGISGDGTLVKTGASDQAFYGANAGFTGTVIINQGLVNLSESATVLSGATAFILNGSGELLGDQDVADIDHIGNAATITLNNTGANRGLWIRNPDLDSAEAETVGAITLGAGHNVIQADSNAGNLEIITLTAASLTRANHATLLVRGQQMDQPAGARGRIFFTAAPAGGVGAGGAAGTTTMSILPYVIGEVGLAGDDSAALATRQGNSFAIAAADGVQLRPLSTVIGVGEEYIHNEAGYNALTGAATNNVRFTINPGTTLTGAATQINSLVLDSSAGALTVNGPASALNIKSGAILATTTTAANGISLGGFSGLTTDAGNDFIVYVTNAANTFTLNSALTSATPLVKSGAGTLALTNTGNAFTDVYLNQGFVQVDNMDKMGAGELKFMGGGIKLAPGFTGDLFAKTWDISTGGGSLDVGLFSGGFTLTGGIVDSTASSGDVFSFFTRATGSAGDDGLLILQGSNVFTGTTIFRNSGIASGVVNCVVLNGNTNAAINGNVEIGNITNINNGFDVVVALGANEQIVDTASITFRGASGENAYFKLMGFTETVAGINDTTREGVIENVESTEPGVATDGKLIVNSSSDFSYNAYMRNRGTGTNATLLSFEKQGSGTQMLIGDRITYGGTTTISGGTLHLQGVTAWNSDMVNNSVLILDETTARTHARDITGTGSLIKQGTAALTFAGGLNLTYQGSTTVKNGTLTIGSAINGTTSLNVLNSGSALALTGGISNASSITHLVVEHGATLSLLDGAGNKLTGLTNLQIGSHGGTMTTLNLNVGDVSTAGDNLNTDLLSLLTGGTLGLFAGNQITLNLTDAGLNPGQTYNLISAADGGLLSVLGSGDWLLGSTPGGFTSITLNKTSNLISITTGTLITGASYWTGLTNNAWNADASNWSTDKAGAIPASSIPGQGTDVVFVADSHAGGALVTTLEQNFKVNSLTFETSTNTSSSVTINPGAVSTSRLEVAPQVATDGIRITAGGPAAVTIAAALKLGADQTWNVADAGAVLTISGSLQGEADVIKTGLGKVVLSAVADPTFNTGLSTDVTINAGIVEITHIGALGTIASGNGARVIINTGGAFYYNNTTASTAIANVPVGLVLGGGTLSVGGAAHFYGGNTNVSSGSLINMRGSNAAATNAAAFSIALTGVLSGSGSLTLDSVDTLTAGNAETGTLTLSNNANSWAGDLLINRGTVVTTAANGLGGGNITYNQFGRIITRAVDGTTYNLAGTVNFAAGALGEFSVDNTGALAADFVINQNGQVNIGSGGTGATVRLNLADAASALNITGGVVLGGNSSISVEGGDANSLVTISGVISDGGSGYTLAVNDEAGAWAVTSTILRLTGLNTFSGNLSLMEGTLQFTTVSNSGGPASSLGQGSAISLGGTLSFIGDGAVNSQSTNRAITQTANSILNVSGTNDATMTYTGAISAGAFQMQLTGSGTSAGFVTGGITQTTIAPDLLVSSGNWTISGTKVTVGDDLKVNGAGTVLNLATTGVMDYVAGTSNFIYLGDGGTLNLGADDVSSAALGLEGILAGYETAGAVTTFNTNTFTITTPRLDVGQIAAGFEGNVIGSGTVIVTGTTAGSGLSLYRGSVSANLSGVGALFKAGMGAVTLSGDNSGLTGTTRLDAGNLILDYTASNTAKLNAAAALDMRGGTLTINGSSSAATTQSATGLTLASGGASTISINNGTGQTATLNLGAITRAASAGSLRINLASASSVVTTSTGLTNGLVGSAGFITVKDTAGTWFASQSGSSIVGLASVVKNDVSAWATGDHLTDAGAGFSGALNDASINSLRFDAAVGSQVTVNSGRFLNIVSGGILVTDQVTAGAPGIFGGSLTTDAAELIITQDSSRSFEIGGTISQATALTKAGNGTLVLSGKNNFTGQVQLQGGTLELAGGNAMGDTTLITLADDRSSTLRLLFSEVIGRLAGGSAASGLETLAAVDIGSHTLTLNQTTASTYSGRFMGDGTILKTGASTFTYDGVAAAFTGTLRIDQGQILMNGSNDNFDGVAAIVLNGSGSLRNDQTNNLLGDRINNNATITLNGTIAGEGLRFRNTDDGNRSETAGALTLGSGHNVITAESTNAGAFVGSWIFASLAAVNNHATLLVRGTELGSGTDDGRIRFTAAPSGGVGTTAGGAIGTTKNLIILPYLVGDVSASGLGNSFVTNTGSTNGLRPLAAAEYDLNTVTLTAGNNTRYTATTEITTLSTINSLVLDSGTAIALTGPASSMEITSGAILAAGAGNHSIGTISGITTGGSRDYTIYVTTAASTLTLSSSLTSVVSLVKSGAGTLSLTAAGTGNAFTDIYLNQGAVLADDLDRLGTGVLRFFGGGVRLAAGFADDLSSKTWDINTGGGTLDVSLVTANSGVVTLANGIDDATASSGETLTVITRSSGTAGQLVIQGSSSFTGTIIFNHTLVTNGTTNSIVLNGTTNAAINGNIQLGSTTLPTANEDVTLALGADEQIVDTASITFLSSSGEEAYFKLLGRTETVAGISAASRGVIENFESATDQVAGNGKLIVNSSQDFSYTGFMRDRASGAGGTLAFEKQGTGTQTLSGANITYTGPTTITGGTLQLTDTTAFATASTITITAPGNLTINRTTGTQTFANIISGSGSVTKLGAGAVTLTGTNTYTGATDVNAGILQVGAAGAGQSGSGTVTVARGATLAGSGIIHGSTIISGGAVLQAGDVTVAGDAASTLTGSGTLTFTAANTAITVQDGGQIRIGVSSPTLDNTVISFANGVFTFNGNDYNTAKDLFDNESAALGLWNVAPASPASHDFINLTGVNGTLSIGNRASGTFGDGSVVVGGMLGGVQVGQVFNLIDWSGAAISGNFDVGGFSRYDATSNVSAGDLDLVGLGAGLGYDVSAFTTYGIVVIVPEPSRTLFLMLGLLGLTLRRRRR